MDITVGLVFIFLLYSLLVTSINETIATTFGLRARMLKAAIVVGMLSNTSKDGRWKSLLKGIIGFFGGLIHHDDRSPKDKIKIGEKFFDHPLIKNYGSSRFFPLPSNPETNSLMVQITFGRSQTTKFGHLKALIQDYVNDNGNYAGELQPYLNRIGRKPSLATDNDFCTSLKNAGKNDPIMKSCQDQLFEMKYYQPANNWFTKNEFTLPLSLLVIYDSTIHSGSVPGFLRKRFPTVVPASGGNEKEWIQNYVDEREKWLANHSNTLLHATVYRTQYFKKQIENDNWNLALEVKANGVTIS